MMNLTLCRTTQDFKNRRCGIDIRKGALVVVMSHGSCKDKVWTYILTGKRHHTLWWPPDELAQVPIEELPTLIGLDPLADEAIARTFARRHAGKDRK